VIPGPLNKRKTIGSKGLADRLKKNREKKKKRKSRFPKTRRRRESIFHNAKGMREGVGQHSQVWSVEKRGEEGEGN